MKTLLFSLMLLPSAVLAGTTDFTPDDELGPALVDLQASTRPFALSPGADERYDRGIAQMYRLEFDKAEAEFREIVASAPEDPAGYFALAALAWWRYSQNFDIESSLDAVQKDFMVNADKAIELSGRMLKAGRDADQAYFFMGGAYGLQGRWYALKRSWWRSYTHGRKGRKFLKKCVELNPGIYDAYLGLGIFDYYAATLPGAIGLAAKLFVGGDRQRGIEYVKVAKDKGRFFKNEARFFLVEIYSMHENDFKAAYAEVEELKAVDPSNMLFRVGEIMTHIQAEDWQGVLGECEAFLGAWQVKPQPGLEQQLAMIYLSAGDALIALKRYDEAVAWLTTGIEKTSFPEKGWVTYCYLRRAQALDLLGRRAEALPDYRAAAGRPNFWDSRKYAKAGLKGSPDHAEVYRQLTVD
ncbi:MAG: tetratricopeptide repeat protein [Elusimicrobiales bacterium]